MASKTSGIVRVALIAIAAVVLAKLILKMVPGLSGFSGLL